MDFEWDEAKAQSNLINMALAFMKLQVSLVIH
jgi:uncharacterized DUF497 family protein